MAVYRQTYDIGNSVVPTAGNTAATGDAIAINAPTASGTITALNAAGFQGQGVRFAIASGETASHQWVKTAAATFTLQLYFRVDSAAPPDNFWCMARVRSSSGNVCKIMQNASRVVSLQNSAGAGLVNLNGNTALPDGWYVLCIQGTVATSTTGQLAAQLYNATTGAAVGSTYSSSAVNLGTANATTLQWGHPESAANVTVGDFDLPAFDTGSTTPIPLYSAPADLVHPSAVYSNGGSWTVTGAADIPTALADASDTTYGRSPDDPAGAEVTFTLPELSATKPIKVTARHQSPSGDGSLSRTYTLLQGSTVIAARTVTLPTSWTDWNFVTTNAETAAITDRTQLRLRVVDTKA